MSDLTNGERLACGMEIEKLQVEVARLKAWNAGNNVVLRAMAERAVAAEARLARAERVVEAARGFVDYEERYRVLLPSSADVTPEGWSAGRLVP